MRRKREGVAQDETEDENESLRVPGFDVFSR